MCLPGRDRGQGASLVGARAPGPAGFGCAERMEAVSSTTCLLPHLWSPLLALLRTFWGHRGGPWAWVSITRGFLDVPGLVPTLLGALAVPATSLRAFLRLS